MIFEAFDGVDDFGCYLGFDGFYSLFDWWVKGELDDGDWWSGFWLVAMLDDGGLIVDGGLGCMWEDLKRREKCEGQRK